MHSVLNVRAEYEFITTNIRKHDSRLLAHRLTTVRNADCISVVQQGKIVEQGDDSIFFVHVLSVTCLGSLE